MFGLDDMTIIELDSLAIAKLDNLPIQVNTDAFASDTFDFGLGL